MRCCGVHLTSKKYTDVDRTPFKFRPTMTSQEAVDSKWVPSTTGEMYDPATGKFYLPENGKPSADGKPAAGSKPKYLE